MTAGFLYAGGASQTPTAGRAATGEV